MVWEDLEVLEPVELVEEWPDYVVGKKSSGRGGWRLFVVGVVREEGCLVK